MSQLEPYEEPVMRAVKAFREGRESDEKCYFCQGKILVTGSAPDEPGLLVLFTCPCKKSSGFRQGI